MRREGGKKEIRDMKDDTRRGREGGAGMRGGAGPAPQAARRQLAAPIYTPPRAA
jgi:hypothetical protein